MSLKSPFLCETATLPPRGSALPSAEQRDPNHEHFRTDHLLPNLKRRTISSGAVTVSAQGVKFLLTLISTAVLARILSPQDFGLVAMVTTVTGLLRVFKDAGLSIATVQRETITHAQVSNLFWVNLMVSGLCSLVVAASAPLLAWVFKEPRLVGITLLLSATYLMSGSAMQHLALLRRQMRFKALAVIEIGALGSGILVGISMAWFGFGYWSLVGSALTMEGVNFLLTWSISRWRPQLPVRGSGTRPMLAFGAHRVAGDFLTALARGTDNLLIGRVYGAEAVGLYSRASHLLINPLQQFLRPISSVFLPALSRLQSQPERYRATFLSLYETIALGAFFLSGLLLAVSGPLTLVLLGPKWEAAIPIFEGFTIAALCVPLAHSSMWAMTSQGRGRDTLIAQSINSASTVLAVIIGLPFGPVGVALSYSLSNLVVRLPLYYYCVGRKGPITTSDLWVRFARHLPVWICIVASTWVARTMTDNYAAGFQLVICGLVGAAFGLGFIFGIQRHRNVALNLWNMVRDFRKRR
jgi:O-antigen/teichoic acid export membrane protein